MIKIHFHKTNTDSGKIIRFVTRSTVNHVSIEIGEYVYEAKMKGGVIRTDRPLFDKTSITSTAIFQVGNIEETIKFLEEQIGKDYDWFGIISFIWIFVPEHIGKWYCSELGMVALMKFLDFTSEEYDQKKTPHDLRLLCAMLKKLGV